MKLKLSELKPNPFKKQISNGELNKEQVDKIKANIKELGFFGSLPVFKKGDNYHLIAGHHRTQALKETYGKDFEVEVVVSDYNEDQVFRGMVIENVSQRGSKFDEMSQNVEAIEKYLKTRPEILKICRSESNRHTEKLKDEFKNEVTSTDISEWLDKQTEAVIKKGVIKQYQSINHNLDEDIKDTVDKVHDKENHGQGTDTTGFTKAYILSTLEREEQKPLAKVLDETREQRVREQGKLVTKYKDAPEEVKEQIKKGAVDLADIDLAITSHNMKQKNKDKMFVEDISKKIDGIIDSLSFAVSDGEKSLKEVIQVLSRASKYLNDMSEGQKARISKKISNFSDLLPKVSNLLKEIDRRI
jgi:hypothetical protein